MDTVNRFDFVPLGKATKTTQGFLKFDANLTRVGVLKYRNADGSIRRELRHPDEVFKNDSLSTLGGATVTDMHPSEMVTPHNHKQLTVGDVSERITHDERFVTGRITVKDDSMITAIGKGNRKELSPGYTCKLDMTPGEYNGEKYDAIQRNITYNHVGIGPKGWGRSGSDVALRLDGDDAASYSSEDRTPDEETKREKPMKIHIDEIEYEAGSQSAVDAWNKHHSKQEKRIDELQTKLDQANGKLEAEVSKSTDLEAKLKEATNLKRMDAMIEARADLLSKGREILGTEADFSGRTDRQIKEAILTKLDERSTFDGKSDAHIDGMFEVAVAHYNPEPEPHLDGTTVSRIISSISTPSKQTGEVDHYDAAAAQERMMEASENAWQQGAGKDN